MLKVKCRICGKKGLVPQIPEGALDTLCEDCFVKVKETYLSNPQNLAWKKIPEIKNPEIKK
jgi:CxxC-x17-CxxC domain-containing protein